MAKFIRSLASGVDRDWSLKPESVPGNSLFHQKRAKFASQRGSTKLRRTTRVVLASAVRKTLAGKRSVTARHRRAIVRKLQGM